MVVGYRQPQELGFCLFVCFGGGGGCLHSLISSKFS